MGSPREFFPWQPGDVPPPEDVDLWVVWSRPDDAPPGGLWLCSYDPRDPPGLARYCSHSGWWDCWAHDFAAAVPAWWMVVPPLPGLAP